MIRFFNTSYKSKARLDGKTVIITGANSGIGKETARDLYRRGARVILACRNMAKAEDALDDIRKNPPSQVENIQYMGEPGELAIYELDFCSFQSVRKCAKSLLEKESAIHILINNAGVFCPPYEKTEDGNELTLQSNYLGHFLLTLLLLPRLRSSGPGSRIVNVASILHWFGDINFDDINAEKSYWPFKAYAQSKLANILFTKELARRLTEAKIYGVNVYAVHPGILTTEISRHSDQTLFNGAKRCYELLGSLFLKNAEQGTQTIIYCSVDEQVKEETGLYYSECSYGILRSRAKSDQYARELWKITCQLLHLEQEEDFVTFLNTVSRQIAD